MFECLGKASPAEIVIPYADSERILLVHVEDVAKMILQLLQARQPAHTVYNAGCESVIVGELKSEIERLNPRLRVKLGGHAVAGNPRRVECSRIAGEFGFGIVPMFERLGAAADRYR
jgi:nucleoside-diphosphate-sugar epimerase